jgi:integrase/recombinase XerD
MASILKRSKAPGSPYYVVYNDASGKQKWVKGYTDKTETQRLANQLENDKTAQLRGDIDPQHEQRKVDRAKQIADHVAQYKATLQAGGNSVNHVRYTVSDIELFVKHSGVTHAANVTRPLVDAWKLSLMEAGIDARSTINRRIGSVQAFLKWLHGQQVLTQYVLLKYGKLKTKGHERRQRRSLSAKEVAALLASATDRHDLYTFALKTLMRWSQIAALKVSGVDFTANTLTFPKKDNQHRGLMHVIPMHPHIRPLLEKLCKGKGRDDLVWADAMPRREDAAKLVRSDCKAAGVDTTHVDFHALRHTGITRLAELNVHPAKVQRLAGHASIETTLGFYTHFKEADEVAAVALL